MGLFSFVGDFVSDVLGGHSARSEQQRYNLQNMAIQQKYTQENMALQNQFNIDAFNRENEYNTPLNQRARSLAAGLNPNFDNTAGVVAQQDSGVSPMSPSGAMPSAGQQGSIGDLLNVVKVGKELSNIKADTKEKEAAADVKETEAEHNRIQNESDKEFQHDERYQNIRKTISEHDLNNALQNKTEKETQQIFSTAHAYQSYLLAHADNLDSLKKQIDVTLPKLLAFYDAQIAEKYASANYSNVQSQYTPQFANAATMQGQAALMQGRAALYNANTTRYLAESQKSNLDASTYCQNLLNNVEYDLYRSGTQEAERRFMLQKIGFEVDNLRQEYNKNKPKESFALWLNRWLLDPQTKDVRMNTVWLRNFLLGETIK